MLTPECAYEFALLVLCIYRESSDQSSDVQHAVGWVIKNRVNRGGWFGKGWSQVILKPLQFSSFNPPVLDHLGKVVLLEMNSFRFPIPETDPAYGSCLLAAKHVYEGTTPDNTDGSTYYFDNRLLANPPAWSKSFIPTVKLGKLNFFRDHTEV